MAKRILATILNSHAEIYTGKYIRPIVLFQAQPRNSEDSTTYEKIKAQLVEMGIPEEFLAGFDMAADSAQADDVSEAALAAAHELFGE